ncbi:MAG: hypothetical protein N2505_00085 [Endomicrobia bacterium]|nr:hypothetical protein [Endomicrobiia bacterium]
MTFINGKMAEYYEIKNEVGYTHNYFLTNYRKFILKPKPESIDKIKEYIQSNMNKLPVIGLDTETTGLRANRDRLLSIQISLKDENKNYLVSFVFYNFNHHNIKQFLISLLLDKNITKVIHNAKFDLEFLAYNGFFIPIETVFCSMTAESVLYPQNRVNLKDTLERRIGVIISKEERKSFGENWDEIWTNEKIIYAGIDTLFLTDLYLSQKQEFKNNNFLEKLYNQKIKNIFKNVETQPRLIDY